MGCDLLATGWTEGPRGDLVLEFCNFSPQIEKVTPVLLSVICYQFQRAAFEVLTLNICYIPVIN